MGVKWALCDFGRKKIRRGRKELENDFILLYSMGLLVYYSWKLLL
jgi:hypothetical protein